MKPIEIRAAGTTDPGLVRSENQDCIVVEPGLGLYLVFDGMGGHQGGEVASALARDTVVEAVRASRFKKDPKILMEEAYQLASRMVHEEAARKPNLHGMGTTVVGMLVINGNTALIAHVGDSRAYIMRDGRLARLTNDHTIVQEMVALGRLTPEEAVNHPHSSVLSRNLGGHPQTRVDLLEIKPQEGDRVLLCSDGLNGYASQSAIEQVLGGAEDVHTAAADLVALAKQGGGGDNVSTVIVDFGQHKQPAMRKDTLPPSGAAAWWKHRDRFFQVASKLGMGTSPIASMLPPEEAMEIIGGNFYEAVYHDLENTTGIHLWTYADSLVRAWFERNGDYRALQELFDILRASSMAVIKDMAEQDENFAVALEVSVLRALIVAEMVVGGFLGKRIEQVNELLSAKDQQQTELPEETFISAATIPFHSTKRIQPAAPEVSKCLEAGMKLAQERLNTTKNKLYDYILSEVHKTAHDFGGEVDMLNAARELYGNRPLSESDIRPIFNAMDACRGMHLMAIDEQEVDPEARTRAYRAAALAHQSLCHGFAMVTVDAGKPTTDRLKEMHTQNKRLRETLARNEARIASLEHDLETMDEVTS